MHSSPAMFMNFPHFGPLFAVGLIVVVAWTLTWKGLALWRAARRHDTVWFVVLLIVNTLGILEIIYLLIVRDSDAYDHRPHNHHLHDDHDHAHSHSSDE